VSARGRDAEATNEEPMSELAEAYDWPGRTLIGQNDTKIGKA
jgi:hypothetical protein